MFVPKLPCAVARLQLIADMEAFALFAHRHRFATLQQMVNAWQQETGVTLKPQHLFCGAASSGLDA